MKKIILFSFIAFTACQSADTSADHGQNRDAAFDQYKQNFVLRLWKMQPGWASSIGYHNYDSVLVIPSIEQMASDRAFYKSEEDSLAKYSLENLSDFNKMDHYLIRDYLKASRWALDTLRSFEWDPSNYNVCGPFSEMLANNYDSLDNRSRNMAIRVKSVPAFYEAAKKLIKSPTPEHTELAILQNEGGVSVFESELIDALKTSHLTADEQKTFTASCAAAAKAVRDYAAWLKQLKPAPSRSFRLGKNLYDQKFKHDIASGNSADEIYAKALARKKELHLKMYGITKELWPKYFKAVEKIPADSLLAIKQMIDVLSLKHVRPDSFQTSIEQQIPHLVKFIREKNLIYLDSTKPLVVRKEPAYMAGMAGASISSPGPYDRNGNTYYNVGSMSGWTKERAESYLREYNQYVLQILNIHEAIPGHYTQLIYSNASAGTSNADKQLPGIIKTIFGNGAMIEGWAVYSELMMLENGYGAEKGQTTAAPEMWLMYYKWNLRSTCNTILDHDIQVNNLSKDAGIRLLTREAFQQQAEAEGKWRRATLSQVQLCSYFTGFSEILALREELKTKMGKDFDLKAFHEKFLSYGSAPVKYIRELMLKDLAH